jgi:hypothetical protein
MAGPGAEPGPAAAPAQPGPGDAPAVWAPVVPRQLPVAARHFAGRAGALTALAGLAAETGGASRAMVIAVIEGTAGIDKTKPGAEYTS